MQQSSKYDRDYYVGDSKNELVNYIALGDSTGVGTGSFTQLDSYPYQVALALSKKNNYVHVINLSMSGARAADIPGQLNKINLKPDIITLSFGANDATHLTTIASYKKSLIDISNKLAEFPNSKIIVATTPKMDNIPALWGLPGLIANRRAIKQNQAFKSVFKDDRVAIIDLYNDARLDPDIGKNYYSFDHFHPSDEGYLVWSKFFIQAAIS
jgi:lysophospholipase L1-like esterase